MKDICCIGHITKDKIVTPNRTVYMAGGTSFYFSYAINQLPKDVTFSLVTAMDPTEKEPVEKMPSYRYSISCSRSLSVNLAIPCAHSLGALPCQHRCGFPMW